MARIIYGTNGDQTHMPKTKIKIDTFNGLLCMHNMDDAYDLLFLSSLRSPLADELSWMSGKKVTVRYWITDIKTTKEEAEFTFMQACMGKADCRFQSHYSDMTCYLWTDEELNVGGHDLMREFKSYVGKWLILEVESFA